MSGEMQARVGAFCAAHGLELGALARFADLASEVGELGKELLRAGGYAGEAVRGNPQMALEAGDCLFSLLALCEGLGIDAEAALDAALAKYAARFDRKGHVGSEA